MLRFVIQAEYLEWIDRRATAGLSAAEMNRELDGARLMAAHAEGVEDYGPFHTGYLQPSEERKVRGR
jgi:hypothetical protein